MDESIVAVPTRRVPVPPVPLAVRLGTEHGPLRQWSPIGTIDSPVLAEVDPAGRVRMADAMWSLDWWVGAEDRWHHPSMEGGRSSATLGSSPVRETRIRVPGGEIVQRMGAAVANAGGFNGAAVVVEFENNSAVPVALALAVSPWTLDGRGAIDNIALDSLDDDGCAVLLDGEPVALIDRSPARVVSGRSDDVAKDLAAGNDEVPVAGQTFHAEAAGDLEVALVFPLAHTATARLLLVPPRSSGRDRTRSGRGLATATVPFTAPPLETVAAGWATHAGSDPRIVAPYEAWSDLVAYSGTELRVAGPAEVTRALDPTAPIPAGPDSGVRLGSVSEALAGVEADDVNNAVAGALAGAQRFSGRVEPADQSDATAALCWSAAAVLLGAKGTDLVEDFVGPTAKAVRWLSKQHRKGNHVGIGGVGPWRCAAALRLAASGLAAVGQPEVAQDALELSRALDESIGEAKGYAEPRGSRTASTFATARAERDAGRFGSGWGLEQLAERIPQRRTAPIADAVEAESVLGCDAAELAETRLAVLDALVRDGAMGPELLAIWPTAWRGNPVEAHGIRTAWGTVSFGLRWHGVRAAVLWEVEPAVGGVETDAAPAVRVPGLDPDFRGSAWSGEALLEVSEGERGDLSSESSPISGGSDPTVDAGPSVGEGESFS